MLETVRGQEFGCWGERYLMMGKNIVMEVNAMRINALKKKYSGEWMAIKVTKTSPTGEPLEGELLLRNHDHDKLWKNLPKHKGFRIYVTYAGKPLEEGYAAAFQVK